MKQVDGTPGPGDGHEPGLFIMDTLIGKTLSHYRIAEKIGAGGMGEVYRAHDSRLGRDVAIKVIPAELSREPDRINRFEQEARAAGALNHPNVCAIYDVGSHEGTPYVVMELLEGESLRDRIAAGPVPLRKALDYAAQVAHGLAAAHEKGIVHRDLKPANLFVTKTGRVKVLDFGLAKLTRPEIVAPVGETTESVVATETGVVLGTVGYMSPEQVRGEPADARSDLFALGAILYELLTGKRAFQGATYVETLSAILHGEPPPVTSVVTARLTPPAVELIVRRCLEKAPEQRFQSASDLAFDLENLSGSSGGPLLDTTGGAARARSRRLMGLAAAFLVGAICVAAGAFQLVQHGKLIAPSRLKFTRLAVQRGMILRAFFSPDGNTVFFAAGPAGEGERVYEVRLGFPMARDLGLPPSTRLMSVSSAGMLAVVTGRSLAGELFDPELAEVPLTGGTPRRLLENVESADYAPDGRTLAITRRVGGKARLEMPPGHVLLENTNWMGYAVVSPDGKRIAFAESPASHSAPVAIMDPKGRILARGGKGWEGGCLAWSPDSREVWFAIEGDLKALSARGRERLVARFDGLVMLEDIGPDGKVLLNRMRWTEGIRGRGPQGNRETELGLYGKSSVADISGDGRTLLLSDAGLSQRYAYAVCVRGMDGSHPVQLGEGTACALSPDGAWALAITDGPPQQLVLRPTGAGDSITLGRAGIDTYRNALWMPDGKSVLFSGSEAGKPVRAYIQDTGGGAPRRIGGEGLVVSAVSPDGGVVALTPTDAGPAPSSRRRTLQIHAIQGDSAIAVVDLEAGETVLQWAVDGSSLYVGRPGAGGSYQVSRLHLATGKRTPWKSLLPSDPAESIRNVSITRDGRSYAYNYFRSECELNLVEGLR